MSRFASIHDKPFGPAAGVICSPDPDVLDLWEGARLAVQHRPLPDDLGAYLKAPSTERMLRPLHNSAFSVHLEDGKVRLSHNSNEDLRLTKKVESGRLASITSFADFYNHEQIALPLIQDMESDAVDVARLFGPEGLLVRVHTLTERDPGFHIDLNPAFVRQHGELAMLVADPQAAILRNAFDERHYFNVLDSGRIRALGQGDRAVVREMPHSPYYTPDEMVYRNGPWLGFYTRRLKNDCFEL